MVSDAVQRRFFNLVDGVMQSRDNPNPVTYPLNAWLCSGGSRFPTTAVAALFCYNLWLLTSHMTAAKRVLQYPKSTADFRLHFNGIGIGIGIDIGNSLVGYSDSDWANHSADRKSQGGHVFLANNGAISWQSRKQSLIAMSTLEAKFIACSEASREAKWLLQLQKNIHSSKKDSPLLPINCDN